MPPWHYPGTTLVPPGTTLVPPCYCSSTLTRRLVFCVLCIKPWHGVNGCSIDDVARLAQEYEKADAEERVALEAKYGKDRVSTR